MSIRPPELIRLLDESDHQRTFVENLQKEKRVDSVRCFSPEGTEDASQRFSDISNITREFGSREQKSLLVDLGVGSGMPCLEIFSRMRDQIEKIVLVDVSLEMLRGAASTILKKRDVPIQMIHADFLEQPDALRDVLPANRRKMYLCLGCTAGNYEQEYALPRLHSLLKHNDRLLLGLGLLPRSGVNAHLKALQKQYTSRENVSEGLKWARKYNVQPKIENVSASIDDEGDRGTKVLRVLYEFPKKTTFRMGRKTVSFKKGEKVQFIETRRFDPEGGIQHLLDHGFHLIAFEKVGNHGLYLCKRGEE